MRVKLVGTAEQVLEQHVALLLLHRAEDEHALPCQGLLQELALLVEGGAVAQEDEHVVPAEAAKGQERFSADTGREDINLHGQVESRELGPVGVYCASLVEKVCRRFLAVENNDRLAEKAEVQHVACSAR